MEKKGVWVEEFKDFFFFFSELIFYGINKIVEVGRRGKLFGVEWKVNKCSLASKEILLFEEMD